MKKALPSFWSFNRVQDACLIKKENIVWQGPFSWPGYEQDNKLKPIPDIAGAYLFTFEYKDGYILRSVGVTGTMKRRFREHTGEYNKGNYTVLDVDAANNGIRKELWHGWQYSKEHREQFSEHRNDVIKFIEKELVAYRVFVTQITDRRKRERVEAAILINIYSSKGLYFNLFDGGMSFKGRYNYEIPIEVKNICLYRLYGMPESIEI